jgi:predicted ester cyclase
VHLLQKIQIELKGGHVMSVEHNKALVRRLYEEGLNKGNLAVADEILAPDYIRHGLAPGAPLGPESTKHVFSTMRAALPDLRITVEDMVGEGDKVVARVTGRGTHKGEYMGVAPTGKQVTVTFIGIYRFAGSKLKEAWIQMDELGMMQQLGVVPSAGQPRK